MIDLTNPRAVMEAIARESMGRTDGPGLKIVNLRTLQHPFLYLLQRDCSRIMLEKPYSDVQKKNHGTNWTQPVGVVRQWSLYNASGRTEDTSTDHNGSTLGKRLTVNSEPLQSLISLLPHLINLRLNLLGPRASLSPHKESIVIRTKAGGWGIKVRFHLPIMADLSSVWLNDHWYDMEQGQIYFFNNGCYHQSFNAGSLPRLHLVWDMLLTEEVMERMFTRTRGDETEDEQNLWGTALLPFYKSDEIEVEYQDCGKYPKDPTPEPVDEPLSVIDYFEVQ